MAQARTIRFGEAYILLQEQDTAAAFVAPCGFETLTMTVNVETNNTNVPDCEDPDLSAWLETDVVSKQMTLEGEGLLDKDAMQMWQDWWLNGGEEPRQVRFFRDVSSADGGGYFQAPAQITAYSETGSRGARWRVSVTLALNGKPVWTPATP